MSQEQRQIVDAWIAAAVKAHAQPAAAILDGDADEEDGDGDDNGGDDNPPAPGAGGVAASSSSGDAPQSKKRT